MLDFSQMSLTFLPIPPAMIGEYLVTHCHWEVMPGRCDECNSIFKPLFTPAAVVEITASCRGQTVIGKRVLCAACAKTAKRQKLHGILNCAYGIAQSAAGQ
jgi:hypothetical protein